MNMKIINAEVYGSDLKFHRSDVNIAGSSFAKELSDNGEIIDASGCYAIPGLIDIHLHGALGADVCDMSLEAFEKIAEYELKNGVTAICPATLTLPVDDLCRVLELGAEFAKNRRANMSDLVGFNMEGPFISAAKKGSQNGRHIIGCDEGIVDRFIETSKGLVKIIGLAPEANPGFEKFILNVKDKVKVALAHTDCDYETARKAFDAGAEHVVHLYNAMRGLSTREPGVVGAAGDYGPSCEIICDGVHVHPSAVRAAYKLMGPENMILVSDSLRSAGMPDGTYDLGGQQVVKEGVRCTLKDGDSIAGSVTNLFDCLRIAVLKMGIPLEKAVASATINPARCIGVDNEYGSIEEGKRADLILVSKTDLSLKKVIKDGNL